MITNEEFLSYRFRPLIGELEINSLPKISEKCPEPFLKYDSLKKELSYQLNSGCENVCLNDEDCNTCLIGIFKGVFRYQDSAFVLIENIKEYYSPFENKADTIIKKYKIGSYQFKATAIKKYAEVGEGILQLLEVNYTVNGQKMEYVNEVDFEFNNKMNLKPVCKIQSDSSLIILLISSTIPNKSGMCGMCPYEEQTFWHLKGRKLEKLFTININIGTSFSSYEYYKNKELITSNFSENDGGYNPIQTYWKNNSTYVFQIEEDSYKRNFYIKFNTYKNTVSVVRGKEFK